MEPRALPFSRSQRLWTIGVLGIAAALPAIGAIRGGFYFIDDLHVVLRSPIVSGERPWWSAFTTTYFAHYAPLHDLFILLEWKLMGFSALGFRLVSILLQWAAAVACWRMLTAFTQRELMAAAITLVWVSHPGQSEAVAWIVEQKTILCGLFAFWALAVFMDAGLSRRGRAGIAFVLMLLACSAKGHGLVIGPIALLYEIFCDRDNEPMLRRVAWSLPLVGLGIATALVSMNSIALEGEIPWTPRDTLLNLPGSLAIYLQVAFLPWTASFFHDMDRVTRFSDPAFFLTLLILLAVLAVLIAIAPVSRRRIIAFCALAWVTGIGPMLNVSKWTLPAYDRFQYMSLPFLYLGAALSIEHLLQRTTAWKNGNDAWIRRCQISLWIPVLALTATLGFVRGRLFRDECLVMQDATEKAPNSCFPHLAICNALIYFYWIPAMHDGTETQQHELAKRIKASALAAEKCWNFKEFHSGSPVVLVSVAHVMQFSHMPEDARNFALTVVNTRWWRPTPGERAEALKLLAELDSPASR